MIEASLQLMQDDKATQLSLHSRSAEIKKFITWTWYLFCSMIIL